MPAKASKPDGVGFHPAAAWRSRVLAPVGISFFFDPAQWANGTDMPRIPQINKASGSRFTAMLDPNMFSYGHPEQSVWMKVLVVDDHVLIREALRSVLAELLPGISVEEASDYSQAIKIAERQPDLGLITLDLALPDRDGFAALAELRERYPATAVVVLSASRDPTDVTRALEMGAAAYIPKTTKREVMLSAFQLVLSGGRYIPSEILEREHESTPTAENIPLNSNLTSRLRNDLGLTERQVAVLSLLMQGKSNKAIARTLNLAEPTVKNHVTAIFKALEVSSRTEAVIKIGRIERSASS